MIWFNLIRFPNLLIVAVTQFFLYFFILLPHSSAANPLALDFIHFGLLILSTMLIAACGFVINDIVDVPIDRVNKPDVMIVDRLISIRAAWIYFWFLFLTGLGISLYLAWHISDLKLVFLYPTAVLILMLYSYYFKKMGLLGNLVVAIFTMFVAGIVLFAERKFVLDLSSIDIDKAEYIYAVFGAYMVFAFLSNIYREIVKDIEDVDGDRQNNYKTMPISMGANRTKVVAIFFCSVLLILMTVFVFQFQAKSIIALIILGGIFMILIYSIILLKKAADAVHYHKVSTVIKIAMAFGLLVIPFL